jgi:hypothetical protein
MVFATLGEKHAAYCAVARERNIPPLGLLEFSETEHILRDLRDAPELTREEREAAGVAYFAVPRSCERRHR